MKVVIIEDEKHTAEGLRDCLISLDKNIEVVALLASVKEAVRYFESSKDYQVVFSDIQLGDGLSFEIFDQTIVHAPVIYCTAYNDYALQAFRSNGIEYLLKPLAKTHIEAALQKLYLLRQQLAQSHVQTEKTIIVYKKDKIIPIKLNRVALFFVQEGVTYLLNMDESLFHINKSLDELESLVDEMFMRINRQCLVNREATKELSQYASRKMQLHLHVPFRNTIIVPKEKVTAVKEWLMHK